MYEMQGPRLAAQLPVRRLLGIPLVRRFLGIPFTARPTTGPRHPPEVPVTRPSRVPEVALEMYPFSVVEQFYCWSGA